MRQQPDTATKKPLTRADYSRRRRQADNLSGGTVSPVPDLRPLNLPTSIQPPSSPRMRHYPGLPTAAGRQSVRSGCCAPGGRVDGCRGRFGAALGSEKCGSTPIPRTKIGRVYRDFTLSGVVANRNLPGNGEMIGPDADGSPGFQGLPRTSRGV